MDSDRGTAVGFEAEALVAELTELAETQTATIAALEAEAAQLRGEREHLKTRLVVAERWLSELARRVEDAEAQLTAQPLTLRGRITATPNPTAAPARHRCRQVRDHVPRRRTARSGTSAGIAA